MAAVKILISGAPHGKLGPMFKRVAAVNKANGPFDYLFCVGSFFPTAGGAEDSADPDAETMEFLLGKKPVPVPCFFVGGFGAGSRKAMEACAEAGVARLQYLGTAGVVNLKGLNVAYLDGLAAPKAQAASGADASVLHGGRYNCQVHWDKLTSAVEKREGDIDLLLTCDWPADVDTGISPSAAPPGGNSGGSDAIARLAMLTRPRYHVCGGRDVFWARAPYMNKDLGAGGHATRFIGLAAVGNADKQKSLHALALVPSCKMDRAVLTSTPEGATGSPYDIASAARKRSRDQSHDDTLGVQDWRWQDRKKARQPQAEPSLGRPGVIKDDSCSIYVRNLPFHGTEADIEAHFAEAGVVVDVRRGLMPDGKLQGFGHIQFASADSIQKALSLHGSSLKGREIFVDAASNRPGQQPLPAGKPVDGCWFCLSNPNADVNLVASVGEECYVAVDKGAINDGHVLIVPIEHYPSSLGVSASAYAEMDKYLEALRTCYAAEGKDAVLFERFMAFRKSGGNHCHINIVQIPSAAAANAREVLDKESAAVGAKFVELTAATGETARTALRSAVGENEFVRIGLPGGTQFVHVIPRGQRFPINFGRDLAAAIGGTPERGDWKQCQVGPEEEAARTERFKTRFKAYDLMQ